MNFSHPKVLPHMDSISFSKSNGLFLVSSNLTRQYWLGQIWYFTEPQNEARGDDSVAMTQVDVGLNDIAALPTDQARAIAGLDSGAISLWEVSDGLRLVGRGLVQEHDDVVTSVSACCDGSRGISAGADRRIKVWDLEEFRSVATYTGHADAVDDVQAHPSDANLFLSCSRDGRLLLWDLRMGQKPASLIARLKDSSRPRCVCWQPGSDTLLAAGTECGSLLYRDCRRGATAPKALQAQVHDRPITSLLFAAHRRDWVATASEDCTAVVSKISTEGISQLYRERRHRDFVQSVAWHPDTHDLYTCGWDTQLLHSTISDVAASEQQETSSDVKPQVIEQVKQQVQNMDVIEASDDTADVTA